MALFHQILSAWPLLLLFNLPCSCHLVRRCGELVNDMKHSVGWDVWCELLCRPTRFPPGVAPQRRSHPQSTSHRRHQLHRIGSSKINLRVTRARTVNISITTNNNTNNNFFLTLRNRNCWLSKSQQPATPEHVTWLRYPVIELWVYIHIRTDGRPRQGERRERSGVLDTWLFLSCNFLKFYSQSTFRMAAE